MTTSESQDDRSRGWWDRRREARAARSAEQRALQTWNRAAWDHTVTEVVEAQLSGGERIVATLARAKAREGRFGHRARKAIVVTDQRVLVLDYVQADLSPWDTVRTIAATYPRSAVTVIQYEPEYRYLGEKTVRKARVVLGLPGGAVLRFRPTTSELEGPGIANDLVAALAGPEQMNQLADASRRRRRIVIVTRTGFWGVLLIGIFALSAYGWYWNDQDDQRRAQQEAQQEIQQLLQQADVAGAAKNTVAGGGGVFAIGTDINPGTWTTPGPDGSNGGGCYYAILSSANTNDIVTKRVSQGLQVADLPAGQYFDTRGCQAWTHQ
jgi:hypothetical protein